MLESARPRHRLEVERAPLNARCCCRLRVPASVRELMQALRPFGFAQCWESMLRAPVPAWPEALAQHLRVDTEESLLEEMLRDTLVDVVRVGVADPEIRCGSHETTSLRVRIPRHAKREPGCIDACVLDPLALDVSSQRLRPTHTSASREVSARPRGRARAVPARRRRAGAHPRSGRDDVYRGRRR